jgi:hypothetical protein
MSEQKPPSAAAVRIAEQVPAVGPGLPLRGLICAAADAEIQPLIEALEEYIEPGCECDACAMTRAVVAHARGEQE